MNRTIFQLVGTALIMIAIFFTSCNDGGCCDVKQCSIHYVDGKIENVYLVEQHEEKIVFYYTKEDADVGKNKVTVPMSRVKSITELKE